MWPFSELSWPKLLRPQVELEIRGSGSGRSPCNEPYMWASSPEQAVSSMSTSSWPEVVCEHSWEL